MLKLKFTAKNSEIERIITEDSTDTGTTYTRDRLERMAHLEIGYRVGTRTTDEFGNHYEVLSD